MNKAMAERRRRGRRRDQQAEGALALRVGAHPGRRRSGAIRLDTIAGLIASSRRRPQIRRRSRHCRRPLPRASASSATRRAPTPRADRYFGSRKAVRLMEMADRFNIRFTLVDTAAPIPASAPKSASGGGHRAPTSVRPERAERDGHLGEGGSGGAIALAVANRADVATPSIP